MNKKETNNGPSIANVAIIGAAVAGLAATAYFFLGPDGKKHQKYAKAWAIKMKGEVIEKLEMAKEVSKPIYDEIIDTVAAEYSKAMKADKSDISELAKELKKQWKEFSANAKKA